MYGNGSNGALNVSSGTTNLNLDQKYQYTTVNVASGATLSTTSTTGSVLYILATTSINIDGTVDVSNKVDYGQNSWSTTIDGVTYTSPSTAAGGSGGKWYNSPAAPQGFGFGGGGQGGNVGNDYRGGLGALGGPTSGSGGSAVFQAATGSVVYRSGISASPNSAGGSGALVISASSGSATSGTGGAAYGNNGANASYSIDSGLKGAAGGGGAGGSAGRPGVHVVLKAPVIVINGTIITSGTNGQNGGNGGNRAENVAGAIGSSSGGGGGGGGHAGSVSLYYGLTLNDSGTYTMAAGSGGAGGAAGGGDTTDLTAASAGSGGTTGSKTTYIISTNDYTQSGYATITPYPASGGGGSYAGGWGTFGFGAVFGGEISQSGIVTQYREQQGYSVIKVTQNQTQTGYADIKATVNRTQTGSANIKAIYDKPQLGFANVIRTLNQTITGYAIIQVEYNKNQDGYATIYETGNRDQSGYAYLYVSNTLPGENVIDGGAYIKRYGDESGTLTEATIDTGGAYTKYQIDNQ